MRIVRTIKPGDSTKKMEARVMVGETKSSWAIICQKLLEENSRIYGVKSYNKYGKRETEQKIK